MTVETRPRTETSTDRVAGLRAIDTDVHNDVLALAERAQPRPPAPAA